MEWQVSKILNVLKVNFTLQMILLWLIYTVFIFCNPEKKKTRKKNKWQIMAVLKIVIKIIGKGVRWLCHEYKFYFANSSCVFVVLNNLFFMELYLPFTLKRSESLRSRIILK